MTAVITSLVLVLSVSAGQPPPASGSSYTQEDRDAEFRLLRKEVEDKVGLEAIRALHQQLDDDNDGTIEPSETGDFIKADLQLGLHAPGGGGDLSDKESSPPQYDGDGRAREKMFHGKDAEITVPDLWATWVKSEVHNWTVEQTVDWLKHCVDLPQYSQTFEREGVDGKQLPRAASDVSFLSKVLGINSSIHRSKISLKAMDVVLFGPPKEPSNWLKDVILTSLLCALLTALVWAYRTKKLSEEQLTKMMKDMDSLARAEQALQDMQTKLVVVEEKGEKLEQEIVGGGVEEVGRLREEVEILRGELHRAEVELEDKCWIAPTVLQHWLQLTYELESQVYNVKKRTAESQMELAKDACEKLKRKRSSFVGAFVSTHGRSIDDVDKSILEAKTALLELTQDLTERSQRWRQIEILTGVGIINNPGISVLQRLVRHVGGGSRSVRGGTSLSSRMSSVSVDDLHDDLETRSLAASVAASHTSHLSGRGYSLAGGRRRDAVTSHDVANNSHDISRESSKESSNSESDELHLPDPSLVGTEKAGSRVSQASMASSGISSISSMISRETRSVAGDKPASPSLRRMRMIKSISQDGSTDPDLLHSSPSLTVSNSDSALSSKTSMVSLLSAHRGLSRVSPPGSTLSEVEESSDTGSLPDLDGKKKKKSFFIFRKKKEKSSS